MINIRARTLCFFVAWVSVSPSARSDEKIKSITLNREGLRHAEREEWGRAEELLLEALVEDPFSPVLRINLGRVFELQKKFDKALKEYESALRIPNLTEEMKFIAHFNAGNAAASREPRDTDLALRHYQEALSVRPNSTEVKTNIELLFQAGSGKGRGGQGGGKGQGENQDPSGNGTNQNPNQNPNYDNKDNQKPQFKSENLTKEDVRKILEELKAQEQKIRAMEKQSAKGQESSPEKDW